MRYVQDEEPRQDQVRPGDEWFPTEDKPFFHKVWIGGHEGWSTGALGERPKDLKPGVSGDPERELAALKTEEENRLGEGQDSGAQTDSVDETGTGDEDFDSDLKSDLAEVETDETSNDEEEENDDEQSVSAEVSDSDGGDQGSGGKSGSVSKQGGKRKGVQPGRKGK